MKDNETLAFTDVYAVQAPEDEVWAALTDPAKIREWHLCDVAKFEGFVGGKIEFTAYGQPVITGEVTKLKPCKVLEHTFRFVIHPTEPTTTVTFTIEGHSTCSRLTLVHSGFPGINMTYRDVVACWPLLICGLQEMMRKARKHRRNAA